MRRGSLIEVNWSRTGYKGSFAVVSAPFPERASPHSRSCLVRDWQALWREERLADIRPPKNLADTPSALLILLELPLPYYATSVSSSKPPRRYLRAVQPEAHLR
jgi:hypothetical protein